MLRGGNFGIVYVDGKGSATNTPRRSLSNSEAVPVTTTSNTIPRTFGSSNIVNSAYTQSPVGASRRKPVMIKTEDEDDDQPYPICEDIGDLVADDIDLSQLDDSDSNWMHRIDVTHFKDIQQDFFVPNRVNNENPIEDRSVMCGTSCENIPISEVIRETTSKRSPWTKPSYSYSCLVALALKNSANGQLTVSEIYDFMCENFPYFQTAPPGWKNSVRHNLSLNKCFQKVELYRPDGQGRKSCLWSLNPAKVHKMDQEVRKWRERDLATIRASLFCPDDLEAIEQGRKGIPISRKLSKHNDDYAQARLNRPIYPRPIDRHSLSFSESNYDGTVEPPMKQSKLFNSNRMSVCDELISQDSSLKTCNSLRRERLRSISVPQGGTLMIPEGSTVREVAAKNLQFLLQNHSSRSRGAVSYMTPTKNPHTLSVLTMDNIKSEVQMPVSVITTTPTAAQYCAHPATTTTFPTINQCTSPNFHFISPKDESVEKETWQKTVLLSPLSTSPIGYGVGTCPYDTVTSALNNNSLLRSALEQSPCRSLTFTAL